jgi:hypothetical protein
MLDDVVRMGKSKSEAKDKEEETPISEDPCSLL